MTLRLILTAFAGLLVAGCTAIAQREAALPEPVTRAAELQSRLSRLVGQFGSAIRLDEPSVAVMMNVAPGPANDETWVLEFLQTTKDTERGFLLVFERAVSVDQITANFIPLQPDGSVSQQSCRMQFRLLPGLLTGETEPQNCRFGEGENSIGLLKEIALSDRQIIIADRLIASTGSVDRTTDILRLHRLDSFSGSLRRRVADDQSWRLSEPVLLDVAGATVEPIDAASMSLDVQIRLLLVEGREAGAPLLYLQATDPASGRVIGQSWADAQVRQIGMALDIIQVNFVRQSDG